MRLCLKSWGKNVCTEVDHCDADVIPSCGTKITLFKEKLDPICKKLQWQTLASMRRGRAAGGSAAGPGGTLRPCPCRSHLCLLLLCWGRPPLPWDLTHTRFLPPSTFPRGRLPLAPGAETFVLGPCSRWPRVHTRGRSLSGKRQEHP